MVFTIKQYSELPLLQMSLYRDGRHPYDFFEEMLENSVVTFAMKYENTGIYKIGNKTAHIRLKAPCNETIRKEYYIEYAFTEEDTNAPGIFIGEFKVLFLDTNLQPNGTLIAPISEPLYIHIIDSFIKSDVVYI